MRLCHEALPLDTTVLRFVIGLFLVMSFFFCGAPFLHGQTFTKITTGIVVRDRHVSAGVSWMDYDNDGDPDLFVTNVSSFQIVTFRVLSLSIVTFGSILRSNNRHALYSIKQEKVSIPFYGT